MRRRWPHAADGPDGKPSRWLVSTRRFKAISTGYGGSSPGCHPALAGGQVAMTCARSAAHHEEIAQDYAPARRHGPGSYGRKAKIRAAKPYAVPHGRAGDRLEVVLQVVHWSSPGVARGAGDAGSYRMADERSASAGCWASSSGTGGR